MTQDDTTGDDAAELSNRQMLAILLKEIAEARRESSEQIGAARQEFTDQIGVARQESMEQIGVARQESMEQIGVARQEFTDQIGVARQEFTDQIGVARQESMEQNHKFLTILMQEIADVRHELKDDIGHLDRKLSGRMDGLEKKVDNLSSDFQTLRIEVHQNQTTFIRNHATLEERVSALETAA